MPTEPEAALPVESRPRPARRDGRGRALRRASWALILALIGVHAWRLWDARPRDNLATIARWIDQRRYDDAERALHDQLRRSPNDGGARMLLARSLAARGDFGGCAAQLHRVPSWWHAKPEARFLEGQAALMVGRADDAEAAWKACIAPDPLHPADPRYSASAAEGLIKLYTGQGRRDEARAVMEHKIAK